MKIVLLIVILLTAINLKAQKDTLPSPPPYDSQNSKDTVGIFDKVDIEAKFPGGDSAWRSYLERNINMESASADVPKKKSHFQQTAVCQFIVCKDGTICEIKVINNVIPSIKKEVERIIASSGNWVPAEQNGKKIKAYRRQPVTFIFDSE